jgi:hypothetical protein
MPYLWNATSLKMPVQWLLEMAENQAVLTQKSPKNFLKI